MNFESNQRRGEHPWARTACSPDAAAGGGGCALGNVRTWATDFMKRQLWDKPRQQRLKACRERLSGGVGG